MVYVVIGVICIISLYVAWASIKEAKAIKAKNSALLEKEYRQNQFAIEQYNRNRPFQLHVKTIKELKEKLNEGSDSKSSAKSKTKRKKSKSSAKTTKDKTSNNRKYNSSKKQTKK